MFYSIWIQKADTKSEKSQRSEKTGKSESSLKAGPTPDGKKSKASSEEKKITRAPTPQKKKEEFVVGECLYRSPCMPFVSIVNLFFEYQKCSTLKLQDYKKRCHWNLYLVHRCMIRFWIMHVVSFISLFCSTCRCFVDFCRCNWCF